MNAIIGVSNRHIHINKEDFKILFGSINMEKEKDLLQTGQYASNLKLKVKTNKSEINNVRVLGPFRDYTQLEISRTDSYSLGINPPIRMSGDLDGAATVTLVGPNGEITKPCAIIAARHLHINKKVREELGLTNIKKISAVVGKDKSATLHDIYVKEDLEGILELHIDNDDANGNNACSGDYAELIIE